MCWLSAFPGALGTCDGRDRNCVSLFSLCLTSFYTGWVLPITPLETCLLPISESSAFTGMILAEQRLQKRLVVYYSAQLRLVAVGVTVHIRSGQQQQQWSKKSCPHILGHPVTVFPTWSSNTAKTICKSSVLFTMGTQMWTAPLNGGQCNLKRMQ